MTHSERTAGQRGLVARFLMARGWWRGRQVNIKQLPAPRLLLDMQQEKRQKGEACGSCLATRHVYLLTRLGLIQWRSYLLWHWSTCGGMVCVKGVYSKQCTSRGVCSERPGGSHNGTPPNCTRGGLPHPTFVHQCMQTWCKWSYQRCGQLFPAVWSRCWPSLGWI